MLRAIRTFCQIIVATVITLFLILMGTGYAHKLMNVAAADKLNTSIFDVAVAIAVTLAFILCTAIFACLRLSVVLAEMREIRNDLNELTALKTATVPPPVRKTG